MNRSSDVIVSTLRQIIRAVDLHSKSLTKRFGLTGPQLLVLKALHENRDFTIKDVAQRISLSQATVTTIIDRLEKLGYVHRNRNQLDKRKVNVLLDRKATDVLDLDPNLLQEDFARQFERLDSWEQSLLISSLQRIAAMMNADNLRATPVLMSGPVTENDTEVWNYPEGTS